MGRLSIIISLLLAGCTSTYTVSKNYAFPNDTTGQGAAFYKKLTEFHDSCWVHDSTELEWKIRCKGDRW